MTTFTLFAGKGVVRLIGEGAGKARGTLMAVDGVAGVVVRVIAACRARDGRVCWVGR